MNNKEKNNNKILPPLPSLALDDQVLLGGEDGLLCLVVSQVSSVEVSWSSALGGQHRGLSSSVGIEAWPGQLLHSELGSSVGLSSGQGGDSTKSQVTTEENFLGFDHLGSSGNIRDLQEAGDGVTVGIVGAGSRCQAGGQLGGGQGRGEEREQDGGHHLEIQQGEVR